MKKILDEIKYIFPRRQKIYFIILFVMMFIGAIFELLGVSLILPFVQMMMDPDAIKNNSILMWFFDFFNLKSTEDFILLLTIGLILIYVFKNVYLFFMFKVQFKLVYKNQARISAILMKAYMKRPFSCHLEQNTSNIVRCVTQDVVNLFTLITSALSLFSEIIIATMLCLFLLLTDFTISIAVIILIGLCMAFILLRFRRSLNRLGKENQLYHGKMIQWINQAMGGLKEIKVLNRHQFFVDVFTENADNFSLNMERNGVMAQIPRLLIESVCVGGVLLVIAIRIIAGADLSAIVPQLSVFAMAAFRLLPSTNRMGSYFNQIMFHKPCIDLIYHELKESERYSKLEHDSKQESQSSNIASKTDSSNTKIIEMRQVSFRYANQETYTVENINLSVPFGNSIGLVGLSGSGKTTLADLILGVLKPEKGKIYYDGKDISTNSVFWSEKVGYIPQNIYLTDDTICNNVAFGLGKDEIDESKVWAALKQAQIDEFVAGLPGSLHMMIGEQGVRLSGGQRQRIGIARALYHNPEVLVLDEATSALDMETEHAVMEAIDSLSGNKTMIIIAHRLTTIEKCDTIYKIDKGVLQQQKS